MKRLIMMLLLVALAIPATAFAALRQLGPLATARLRRMTRPRPCRSSPTAPPTRPSACRTARRSTATASRSRPSTWRRDGVRGAVVENDGATMNVKNLKIDGGAPRSNNCGAVQRRRLHVRGRVDQGRHADQHRADAGRLSTTDARSSSTTRGSRPGSPSRSRATPSRTTTRTGSTCAATSTRTIIGNTVTGSASDLIARNGIVVRTVERDHRRTQVGGNMVSGNYVHCLAEVDACGILVIERPPST